MKSSGQFARSLVGLFVASALSLWCTPTSEKPLTQTDLIGYWVGVTPVEAAPDGYWWHFVDTDRYRSFDGCNWAGGRYSVVGGRVVFEDSGSTARGCENGAIELLEPLRFQIEERGKTMKVLTSAGELTLTSAPEPYSID